MMYNYYDNQSGEPAMSVVKPVSDLRNKFRKISALVHEHEEPVIITRNGESDMVVMSFDHYTRIQTRLELYEKLAVAEAEDSYGAPLFDAEEVIRDIRRNLGAKKVWGKIASLGAPGPRGEHCVHRR